MRSSLTIGALANYFRKQCSALFPDEGAMDAAERIVRIALDRTRLCFSATKVKYYWDGTGPVFNHLNSDQYTIFLYYLSNSAFKEGEIEIASKAYLLNKALHSVDIFFEINLPEIWGVRHPVGTVLGRAEYADYLVVYQQCLVGIEREGSPTFQGPAVLFGGSKVVGNCMIGANSWISLGTTILNQNVSSNSVVAGASPRLEQRPTGKDIRSEFFGGASSAAS